MNTAPSSVKKEISVDSVEDMQEYVIKNVVGMSKSEINSFDEQDLQRLISQGHKSDVDVFINPDTFGYTIENHNPTSGFDLQAVYPLMTNSVPSEDVERGVCYARNDDGDVTKIRIEGLIGDSSSTVKHIRGLPVVNDDGERLCFKNPKSGSETIHVARLDEPSNSKLSSSYNWSACGFGSSRKSKDDAIYVDESDLTDDYITRVDQNGDVEIVGKICGRCQNTIQ